MQRILIIDIAGTELTTDDKQILQNKIIAGVILFARNCKNASQIKKLIAEIKSIDQNLQVCVDQEGGRVQRVQDEVTILPPAATLGLEYDSSPSSALDSAYNYSRTLASDIKNLGFDFSFTPVLDLLGDNLAIKDRALHREPKVVVELASKMISAMHDSGMIAVGKHFPGHGFVTEDSHLELPVDNREYSQIASQDLIPFKLLHDKLDAIMTAHIVYPQVCEQAVTFSKKWLKEILRETIGFKGTIYSDDLTMQGARDYGSIVNRAKAALAAGCDKLIVCNDRASVLQLLNAAL